MIRITSKRNGFRRCGMPHYREPVVYLDDRFTEEELKILKAEPMLIVEIVSEVELVSEEETGAEIEIEAGTEPDDLLEAVRAAIEAGKVTKDGRPTVEAIEKILGRDISAKDRDEAYEKLQA